MATFAARHISFSYVIHNKKPFCWCSEKVRRAYCQKKWRDFFCISYSGRVKYRSRREFFFGKKKKKTHLLLGERADLFTQNITGGRRASEKVFFNKRNTFSGLFGRNEGRRRRRRLIASRCLMTYGPQKSDLCGILQRRRDSFLKSALKRAIIHCLKMP